MKKEEERGGCLEVGRERNAATPENGFIMGKKGRERK